MEVWRHAGGLGTQRYVGVEGCGKHSDIGVWKPGGVLHVWGDGGIDRERGSWRDGEGERTFQLQKMAFSYALTTECFECKL